MAEQEGFDLDWREACALLGCSQSHFYNLVNAGVLPAVRNGRRKGFRVRREDCLRYMTSWRGEEWLGDTLPAQHSEDAKICKKYTLKT